MVSVPLFLSPYSTKKLTLVIGALTTLLGLFTLAKLVF